MKRTKTLKVRLTEDGYDYLLEEAEKRGWNTSELTRYALNVYLSQTFQEIEDSIEKIDDIRDDQSYKRAIRAVKQVPLLNALAPMPRGNRLFPKIMEGMESEEIAFNAVQQPLNRQQKRALKGLKRKKKRVATNGR